MANNGSTIYKFGERGIVRIEGDGVCIVQNNKIHSRGRGKLVSQEHYDRVVKGPSSQEIIRELLRGENYSGENLYFVGLAGKGERPVVAGPLRNFGEELKEPNAYRKEVTDEMTDALLLSAVAAEGVPLGDPAQALESLATDANKNRY